MGRLPPGGVVPWTRRPLSPTGLFLSCVPKVLALYHRSGMMCNMKAKNTFLTVRLSRDVHQAFRAKSTRFGGASEVLRELVMAFLEDRLTIQPPSDKESLYDYRSKD